MATAFTVNAVMPWATQAAREANVPVALVLAIAKHESAGFRPDARREEAHINDASHGLMQLLLTTARGAGYAGPVGAWNGATRTGTGLYDPLTNLRVGAMHLRTLLSKTNGDIAAAVSAYNAGLGNAKRATVPMRFCERWKPSAPATGRVLDRDCASIRTVRVGEFPNQPYVDRVLSYLREFAVATKTPETATAYVAVGAGGGVGPAGDSSSGPSSDPSATFVLSTSGAVLLAAVLAGFVLARRFLGGQ